MSLVSRMNLVYNRVYGISDRLGVPTHCTFKFVSRDTAVETEVVPRPRVGSPPVNKLTAWERSGVEVNNDMVYVTGISRTYNQIRKGTFCTIDGKPYTIMWLDSEKSVTFDILCRPERSR